MYSRSTRKLRTAVIGREEEEPGQLLILTVINVACEIHSEGYPVLPPRLVPVLFIYALTQQTLRSVMKM
jgi:hypothetical protein